MSIQTQDDSTATLKVAQNAAYGFGGSVFGLALKVALSIVVTRSVGPQSFGIYVLATAILSFGQVIALFGMENSLVRFVSRFKALGDIPRLRGAILWGASVAATLGVLVCMLILWLSSYLGEKVFDKPTLISILQIMAVSLPLSNIECVLTATLQGVKLLKYKVLVQQVWVPSFRFLTAALAVATGHGLAGIAWAYVVADALGAALSAYFVLRNVPEVRSGSPIEFVGKEMTIFSLPLLFSGIFNAVISRVDVLIVGHFLSAAMVGVYGTAQRLLPLIITPLGVFNNVFAPIISDLSARNKREELEEQFKVVAKWIFTTSLPIFAFLSLFSKQVLSVFGPGFVEGWQSMIVLSSGQMINAATGSVGFMLMMTGRPQANLFNSGFLCVTSILLNVYLIPRYGIIGAAYASAFSIGMVQLLRLAEVWYFLGMHPYRRDFFKPVLSCIGSAVPVAMLFHVVGGTGRHVLILPMWLCIFLLLYGALLWSLRLSAEDYIVLKGLRDKVLRMRARAV